MKKLLLIWSILILAFGCKPKTGIVSGNAYWKYNDYVGDKPDAGSHVYLFPRDTSDLPLITTCDVQGNFKFEKVPVGLYILMLVSDHTTSDGYETYEKVSINPLETFFGSDLGTKNKSLKDSVLKYNRLFVKSYDEPRAKTFDEILKVHRKRASYEDKRNTYADSLLKSFAPTRLKNLAIRLGRFAPKIEMEMISVDDDKTESKVVNFGVTYM